IVGSVVSNSRASVLIATLTTVTSRIDMIAPSTTTHATIMRSRSRPVSWVGAEGKEAMRRQASSEAEEPPPFTRYAVRMALGSPAPERPLRADAERNRARLLDAARELFAERGLDVSMDEIAHHAGVGVGTAYRRFGSRDELIGALFEARMEEYVALAEDALREPDAWAALARFLERSIAMQAADRGLKDLVFSHSHALDRVVRVHARMLPLVETIVERAQAAGALRPDLST